MIIISYTSQPSKILKRCTRIGGKTGQKRGDYYQSIWCWLLFFLFFFGLHHWYLFEIHFIQCFLRYLLGNDPFYPVLFEVSFRKRSILSSAFLRYILEKGPYYPVLFEVSFRRRSILSRAFWGIFWKYMLSSAFWCIFWKSILSSAFWVIFWKKFHFIQCFLRYILEKVPFFPVLFRVSFGNPFYPVLFEISFGNPFYSVLFEVSFVSPFYNK